MDMDRAFTRIPVYPWGSEGKIGPQPAEPRCFVLLPKAVPITEPGARFCETPLSGLSALRGYYLCACQECTVKHGIKIYWKKILLPWVDGEGRWVYAAGFAAEVERWPTD